MNKLILADCLSALPKIADESVNLVLTDPPYLVNYQDRSGRSIANDKTGEWLQPTFAELHRVLRPDSFCVSFYGWTKIDHFFAAWKKAGFRVVGHIVFNKGYASSSRFVRYQHESAFLLAKGNPALPENPIPDVLPWRYSGNKYHPTQKPLDAMKTLVEAFSKPGDLVLDPFAGSGTTCVAAYQAGRNYLGIELDPNYYAIASQRLATEAIAIAA